MDSIQEGPATPPTDSTPESADEYRRVRELLLGGERRQLNYLHHQLQEISQFQKQLGERYQALQANEVEITRRLGALIQRGDEYVSQNLTAALQRRLAGDPQGRAELLRALEAPVEENLHRSLWESPERVQQLVAPVVETQVNRSFREVFLESGLERLVRFRKKDGKPRLAWPVALLVCLSLVVLTGWLVLSIKENLALEKAVATLRAEPGIVVTNEANSFLGKPEITGLHDPLAPEPVLLLTSAGLNTHQFDLDFQPFQSVDTTYAQQREQDRVRDLEDLRKQVVNAISALTKANAAKREQDLETVARGLFAVQLPGVREKVTLTHREDRWVLEGTLEEPLYSQMMERVATMELPGGAIDASRIENATANRAAQIRAGLAEIQLRFKDGTAEFADESLILGESILARIGEIETVNATLNRMPVSFAVHGVSLEDEAVPGGDLISARIQAVEAILMQQGSIPVERILPGVIETTDDPDKVGAYVQVVDPEF